MPSVKDRGVIAAHDYPPAPLPPPVYWLVASHWETLGNQCSATCFGEYKCQRHHWNETRKQVFQLESKRANSSISEPDFRCVLSKADSCLEGKHGQSAKDFSIAEFWMPLICWDYLFFISFDGFACSPQRSQYWCPTGIDIRLSFLVTAVHVTSPGDQKSMQTQQMTQINII